MYVDPDGRFAWWLAPIIGAALGTAAYTVSVALSDGGFNNWNWGDFFKSAGLGAASGMATYGIGAGFDALKTGWVWTELGRGASHGLLQGGLSALDGGDFWSGFGSGSLSSVASSAFGATGLAKSSGARLAFGGLSGGIGAALTGGDFWKGVGVGLTVTGLNHLIERGAAKLYKPGKRLEAWRDAWETSEKNYVETGVYGLETGESVLSFNSGNTHKQAQHLPYKMRDGKYCIQVQRMFKMEWVAIEDYTHTHVVRVDKGIGISDADNDIFTKIGSAHIIYMGDLYQMTGIDSYRALGPIR